MEQPEPLGREWDSDARCEPDLREHRRLNDVLLSWEGTPYAKGQRIKETGVDCIRFVWAVWRELGWAKGDEWPPRNIQNDISGLKWLIRRAPRGPAHPGSAVFPKSGHIGILGPDLELWQVFEGSCVGHNVLVQIPNKAYNILGSPFHG